MLQCLYDKRFISTVANNETKVNLSYSTKLISMQITHFQYSLIQYLFFFRLIMLNSLHPVCRKWCAYVLTKNLILLYKHTQNNKGIQCIYDSIACNEADDKTFARRGQEKAACLSKQTP